MNEMVVFDTKHTKSINDCVLDYYAKRLATCSSDNSVKVFDVSSLSSAVCVAELRDHTSAVWRVCWSHPKYGGLLASCSYDKSVIVYKEIEANKYGKIYISTEHKGSINSIEWAPYELGLHLGCASSDGYISIVSYNLNKENSVEGCWHRYSVKAHLNGVSCISWEKKSNAFTDEKHMNDTTDQFNSFKLVSGGFDNQVIIWIFDNNSKEFHKIFQMRDGPHKSAVKDVAWKPNTGNSINIIASCSDKQVILWEEDVNANIWTNKQVIDFQHKIDRIAWSPNGTILAVSCDNENVVLYKENEEGLWINLYNLSSTEVDFPSNSVTSGFKDYAEQGFPNTLNDIRGVDREEIQDHYVYDESYQQTSVRGQQMMNTNYMNVQNIPHNINQDTKDFKNAQHLQPQPQPQSHSQFQLQSQSHMQLHSMDPMMNAGYTQQGMRHATDRNKDMMYPASDMDLNRNTTNNESFNMPNKYQTAMYMDPNKSKIPNAALSSQNAASSEQFATNAFANMGPNTNNMMNNALKNTSFHQTANVSSHPPLAPPPRSNKYELEKTQNTMYRSCAPTTSIPPPSAVPNTHMDNNLSRNDVSHQPIPTTNMNYPPMGPSSTFPPQQIHPPRPTASTVTNPNANTFSSVSQQPGKFANRPDMNVASSASASAFSPSPDSSMTPSMNPPPPSFRMPTQNLNAARKSLEHVASSPVVPPPVATTQKPQTPFANMPTGMNTGNMGSTINSSGQVAPPPTYMPPPTKSSSPMPPINTGPSQYPPFNQNINKGMASPLNINNSTDSADGRSATGVLSGTPSGQNITSISNLMGHVKPAQCSPPPPPPSLASISHPPPSLASISHPPPSLASISHPPPSVTSISHPPPSVASLPLQTGGSNVNYGRPYMPNNMGMATTAKPYMNQNEYTNTNEPPPLNRPMN